MELHAHSCHFAKANYPVPLRGFPHKQIFLPASPSLYLSSFPRSLYVAMNIYINLEGEYEKYMRQASVQTDHLLS